MLTSRAGGEYQLYFNYIQLYFNYNKIILKFIFKILILFFKFILKFETYELIKGYARVPHIAH